MDEARLKQWIQYHSDNLPTDHPLFEACEWRDDLVHDAPEEAWLVVLKLVEVAPDQVLGDIAAGPLEDILCREAERFAVRAEELARNSERFRRCLTGVWGLPKYLRERLAGYIAQVKNPL